MNSQSRDIIDKMVESMRKLPLKEFVLTFNLINDDVIKVKVKGRDASDIRRSLEQSRLDFDKTDINKDLSIYRDHIIWFGIDEN